MKYKSVNLLFLAIAIIFSMSLVLGATTYPNNVTLLRPTSGATVTGTYTLNATNITSGGMFDVLANCTFYARSAGLTANTTWITLGTFRNATSKAQSVNGTFNSAILEDGTDYVFNVTCLNLSEDFATSLSATGVIIQNTVPTAPSSLSPTSNSVDTDGLVTFSATVVDRETTGDCTLFFVGKNPGSSSYNMPYSGSTCTSAQLTIAEQGYEYYIRATDGTDTTDSAKVSFSVDSKSSAGKTALLATQKGVTATGGATLSVAPLSTVGAYIPGTGIPYWFVGVLILIVLIIVAIYKWS